MTRIILIIMLQVSKLIVFHLIFKYSLIFVKTYLFYSKVLYETNFTNPISLKSKHCTIRKKLFYNVNDFKKHFLTFPY